MPSLKVSRNVHQKPAQVFAQLRKYYETRPPSLGGVTPRIRWEPDQRRGHFEEMGIVGSFWVSGENPCRITIEMEIPPLLAPMREQLKEIIKKHLADFN